MRSYRQLLKRIIRHRHHFKPKVSIIVPFYNSEKYLERCLSCIVNSTTLPCEIICVDDGSADASSDIVKKYMVIYKCIKLISCRFNEGLYHARLIGIEAAKGEYIGFVDSDDTVSDGYFDLLYHAASCRDNDIAVGQIINCDIHGGKYLQTRCASFPYGIGSNGDSLVKKYWIQEGRCYHFHVVWNKIYRTSLLKEALGKAKEYIGHHVMLEDFVFSSIWFGRIKSYATVEEARYYYHEKEKNRSLKKISKDLADIKDAFEFVGDFIDNTFPSFASNFGNWKDLYGRIWKKIISEQSDLKNEYLMTELQHIFGDNIGDITDYDEYYYMEVQTCFLKG